MQAVDLETQEMDQAQEDARLRALLSAGISAGDEVITSPFSFVASANSILYVGAKPIFADIDSRTYNINPDEIEKKITSKTKAIMPVHIFGQTADMDPILAIARERGGGLFADQARGLLHGGHAAATAGLPAV